MAPRQRFNPIDFYRKPAPRKPLAVRPPRTRYTQPTTPRLSTVGHLFDKAAPMIADYITAEKEKERAAAARAEMKDVLSAYYERGGQRAYDAVFDSETDGEIDATYEDFRSQAQAASERPGGIEAVRNLPQSVSKEAQDMRIALMGDAYRQEQEREARDEKRLYEEGVAERKIEGQIKLAGVKAKPPRRTAKVEQAESLFAARRAVRDAKTDEERATAQAVVDSLEFVIKGQDPESAQKLEEAKLAPQRSAKGRTAWATFDSKMAPLQAMARTVKGILYGDGTEKGKARAKSGLEYRSGYSSVISPLAQTEAARYTQAQLTNLTSQIKQNVLQAYRLMGHTGGAVGQVSDAEQKMFANNITAMEQSQSYEDYVRSLKRIITFVYGDGTPENVGSMNRLRAAYTKEFGSESSYFPKSGEPKLGSNKPSLTDLLKLYGG